MTANRERDCSQEDIALEALQSTSDKLNIDFLGRISHQDSSRDHSSTPSSLHLKRDFPISHSSGCCYLRSDFIVCESEDDSFGCLADLACFPELASAALQQEGYENAHLYR